MIKNLRKKGFTIVELVIVIAVIAILAAILIPTFSGIIKKANIASDTAMAKNMNTALVMADSEGNVPEDMGDVLFILYEAGYALENLNPTTNGYYFVWDSSTNQILFLTDTFEVHYNSKAYSDDTLDWYMPVDEASDVIEGQKFSYTMATDLAASFTFDYLANFDTNGFYLNGNLSYDSADSGEFTVSGMINGTLTVKTPSAILNHFGSVDNVVITAIASASYHEYGFVKSVLDLKAGRLVVENTGFVNQIYAVTALEIVNNGYVAKANLATYDDNGERKAAGALTDVVTQPSDYVMLINNLNQLEAFRDAVNAGMYSEGLTIRLTSDIDLTGIAWTPIGAFPRDDNPDKGFKGIFDGGNHKIIGLSNKGYTVKPLALNQNSTTPGGYKEIIYGFFGVIMNKAEVKNIEFTNVDIDIPTTNETLGDSVAAAVGFAGPKGVNDADEIIIGNKDDHIIIDNIKVSGQIKAYDSPAGIIGRSYALKTTITNCVNNANIISIRKAAGILGNSIGNKNGSLTLENCINNGDVTSQANKEGTNDAGGKGTGYYIASGIFNSNQGSTASMTNCKNYGDISASITVNKLTNHPSLITANATADGTATLHN